MNYFSHAYRFLGRPEFVVGTAVPDLLSAVDRRVRVRESRMVGLESLPPSQLEVIAGIRQHLSDDDLFHRSESFHEVTSLMTRIFRTTLGDADGFRHSLLGHIVTEMLLDGVLIARHPEKLDQYYDEVGQVDPDVVQSAVNHVSRHATTALSWFLPAFVEEQFLRDYLTNEGLNYRLNQVCRRIRLGSLPEVAVFAIAEGRTLVASRADDLLPGHASESIPRP